jgi:hypothetical protein
MKSTHALRALALTLIFVPLAAYGGVRDDINRTFDARAGGHLVLKAAFGDVEVRTQPGSKVDVRIEREAKTSSDAKARELFEEYRITLEQSGDRIEIRGEAPKWGWRRSSELRVKFLLTVPSEFNIDLRTAGGDIGVADLKGTVAAATSGGDLTLGRVDGEVRATTSGGDVRLQDVTGDVVVKTSGGDIEIGRVGGRVEARTSGGDIKVRGSGADLTVSTSGGNIDLHELEGSVSATTSGGRVTARLAKSPGASSKLSSSGGSIDLYLAPGVQLDIDASTSGGRVSSDVPVTVSALGGKSRLSGTINGGGPTMTVRTSGGSIRIRKLE